MKWKGGLDPEKKFSFICLLKLYFSGLVVQSFSDTLTVDDNICDMLRTETVNVVTNLDDKADK